MSQLQPAHTTQEPDGTVKAWYRIAELLLDASNARQHGERDLTAIADSVEQFEQQKPVVIDADGIVRAGNGTCQALLRKGVEFVWGVRSPLRGEKAVAYALADNRTAELSTWDYQTVAENLKWLEEHEQDITRLGWADYELDPLLNAEWKPPKIEDEFEGESIPEALVTVKMTVSQHEVVMRAVAHMRLEEDDTSISDGRALELICANYLS